MTRYLRIGEWDRENPRAYSRNYANGTIEAGLSVYDLDASGKPVVSDESEWGEVDLRERLASDDPKFIVTGDLIGEGGDGEPLLINVREISRWP